MKKSLIVFGIIGVVVMIGIFSCIGKYNALVAKDEGVKTAWGQVQNVYQRRLDLIPNLVNTVKGAGAKEEDILTAVTEARSKATQITVTPQNAQEFADFQKAQAGVSSALSRLLAISENYPDLKSIATYQDLMVQLEGTENRISTERKRYNEVVQDYNTYVRRFPNNIVSNLFGFEKANLFEANQGAEKAPEVKF